MVLVIFSGRVHDRTGLHADLLEEIPHFLINVLLEESKGHRCHDYSLKAAPWNTEKAPLLSFRGKAPES